MHRITTEILVLGGGATGTGVTRDLAMRGFKTIMVERSDLANGTTGRYHGLLHSGGRYAVRDPLAAQECIEENRILRRIMPHCIEDTGGFFVLTPWDDPEYTPKFVEGCKRAGIIVEEISTVQMLREEPLLNPRISRCFRVPDGSADSFMAAQSNIESARSHNAGIYTYHQVKTLRKDGNRVTGAIVHDLIHDEEMLIEADIVVNALGAWCGQAAATVGIPIRIVPGKGTMLAINHRIINTVVNRCKMPSDGDIIVPAHTVAVIGTTDVPVEDPDRFSIEPWEVQLMMDEGEKLIPGMKDMRILRAWAGVRPLYKEDTVPGQEANRAMTRAFALLDHETRDGIAGLVTITGGKWTTYRKMAEATSDLVCMKLGVQRPCRTHLEELPGAEHGHHWLGSRLANVEEKDSYGSLVCECELVTVKDVEDSITLGDAQTIDDIRRDVRLGMGPCQGGFCIYRVAGILHTLRQLPVQQTNAALRDFLKERWKGLLPVLWGQQLRQERLDQMIYLSVFNAASLPGEQGTRLAPSLYEPPSGEGRKIEAEPEQTTAPSFHTPENRSAAGETLDVLVIGAGLAGLTSAWQVAARGKKVRLISKGMGSVYWNAGCIDVLDCSSGNDGQKTSSPAAEIERLVSENPSHPYALAGIDNIHASLEAFKDICTASGYPMEGSLEKNWLLPTALGTLRTTCLAPGTMTAGDMHPGNRQEPCLIVGFQHFLDFFPALVSANLQAQGIEAESLLLDLGALKKQKFVTSRSISNLMETPDFRDELVKALHPHIGKASRVGFPAFLGLDHAYEVHKSLEAALGRKVFEIPLLPPSIPGIRLVKILTKAIEHHRGRVFDGMLAVSADASTEKVLSVHTEAAARLRPHRAEKFILATGNILGGGISTSHDGKINESIFHLPVNAPGDLRSWLRPDFLAPQGHPIFFSGISVNAEFQPSGKDGQPIFDNLFCVGSSLAGFDPIRERSVDGIALVSGYTVGKSI